MPKMHPSVLKVVDFFGFRRRALPVARKYPRLTKWVAGFGFLSSCLGISMAVQDMAARYDTPAGGDTLEVAVALGYIGFMGVTAVMSVAMLAAAEDVKRGRAPVKSWDEI